VGSGVSLALWMLLTGLLALYVVKAGSFGTTYGPLTGTFALLLWANLSSVALFLGVAFAAQLEAVRAGSPTPATDDPLTAPDTDVATELVTMSGPAARQEPTGRHRGEFVCPS
jgi:uncharacterized BrkB/YihY/UPF0761 family membrane protein